MVRVWITSFVFVAQKRVSFFQIFLFFLNFLKATTTSTIPTTITTTTLLTTMAFNSSYPGIALNYSKNDLINAGFRNVYDKFYSVPLTTLEILGLRNSCNSNSILCAAGGLSDSNILNLVSCANCYSVLTKTNTNSPRFVGSAYWYLTEGKSFGFSKLSSINQNTADYNDHNDEYRLSWHLDYKDIGGWRVGSIILLNLDNRYKKYIYIHP